MSAAAYTTSLIKRRRRTNAEMDTIRHALLAVVNIGDGMTVRHLFYRLVDLKIVEKTETAYEGTVAMLAVELRRSGDIPYGKIIDGSRLYTVPITYDGVDDALSDIATLYRRSYWRTADVDLELWCEKDAIRALIQPITWAHAVPMMVSRGFSSETVCQSLAHDTIRSGKPRVILSLNDYDPSGSIMLSDILRRTKHYAPNATFITHQVALTRDQVDEFALPTRPTKIEGNTHAKHFKDARSVELDALPPEVLRKLVADAIDSYIDLRELAVMKTAEWSERSTLRRIAYGDSGEAA